MNSPLFVANEEDAFALRCLELLEAGVPIPRRKSSALRQKFNVRVLTVGKSAPPLSVALFSLNGGEEMKWPNHHARFACHRLNSLTPTWASTTPFVVAVRESTNRDKRKHLPDSLGGVAHNIAQWYPWGGGCPAPWAPVPGTMGEENRSLLEAWITLVKQYVNRDPKFILQHSLETVYGNGDSVERAVSSGDGKFTLVVMGCAPFNQPHTDVADLLVPQKAEKVVKFLGTLLTDLTPFLREVVFVVAGGDFVSHLALRASLHPFFWPSVASLEIALGKGFVGQTRLFGKTGARSDAEVAEALEAGKKAIINQIVCPVSKLAKGVSVRTISWTEHYGIPLLDKAWEMSKANEALAIEIYEERVRLHEWYATVERAMGREAGVLRTKGNNAVYLADAWHLKANPSVITLDTEVDEQFWMKLKPLLVNIWGSNVPYIGRPTQDLCQPWSY